MTFLVNTNYVVFSLKVHVCWEVVVWEELVSMSKLVGHTPYSDGSEISHSKAYGAISDKPNSALL